jgi:dephospho-CoA kinase
MIKVGITGGIGSGKTTVCHIFEALQIPIYYADDRAKWLMTHDAAIKTAILDLFGEAAYLEDGALNRGHIANIVFKNSSKLSELNQIVHPAVAKDGENWFERLVEVPYAIKEAALLIESGSHKQLDQLIVVTAPLPLRIERVMSRDNATREDIEARIAKQMEESAKVNLADFVINNDGQQALIPQVLKVHQQLLHLSTNFL